MPPKDLTTEILKDIRDELRQTRTELKGELVELRARLGEINTRLDPLWPVVDGAFPVVTAITDLHRTLREAVDLFRAEQDAARRTSPS